MRTGTANLPLHGGHCPPWLFERMRHLGAAVIQLIAEEYGTHEVLRRLSDPIWFQAFGCVLGFDWHSSGLTTTVCAALKEGLEPRQRELGLFWAGGKGKASRKTPEEIVAAVERHGLGIDADRLTYASRMSAKVDNAAVRDGYQLYHHFFIFTADGSWAVVQQGMSDATGMARRYHWLSLTLNDFVEEPHAAVCGVRAEETLNLVATESGPTREASVALSQTSFSALEQELRRIEAYLRSLKERGAQIDPEASPLLARAVRTLDMPRAHAIPQAGRLERALRAAQAAPPADFEQLLATPGVGPATLRALALVAEVTHGVRASFRDPVRYAFAHGGKDGHPFPVRRDVYDQSIAFLEQALRRAQLGRSERLEALRRLSRWLPDRIR
ncbi:MAG TPA: DUF763 domain-containing protein [Limnochordia bacterium]